MIGIARWNSDAGNGKSGLVVERLSKRAGEGDTPVHTITLHMNEDGWEPDIKEGDVVEMGVRRVGQIGSFLDPEFDPVKFKREQEELKAEMVETNAHYQQGDSISKQAAAD